MFQPKDDVPLTSTEGTPLCLHQAQDSVVTQCLPVQVDLHYNGFCNSVLWQLFHYIPLNLESKLSDTRTLNFQWEAHQEANRKFAEVAQAFPLHELASHCSKHQVTRHVCPWVTHCPPLDKHNKSGSCQCCCCLDHGAAATRAPDVVPGTWCSLFSAAGARLQLAFCCPSRLLLLSVLSAASGCSCCAAFALLLLPPALFASSWCAALLVGR